jgi:hypothetical protein
MVRVQETVVILFVLNVIMVSQAASGSVDADRALADIPIVCDRKRNPNTPRS